MASSSGGGGGGGGVPPGFRFHPTDEELLHYYLKKKISFQKFDMDVIREVDLNKIEPWDLQERCNIGSTPQNEWYFFSHKDRKYPTGSRTNRATSAGFWKATGRDKCIRNTFKKIGMRKTLVFYRGRAPHGQKTDWIMHEYRLEDSAAVSDHHHLDSQGNPTNSATSTEDGWVICRVFKKKNLFKVGNEGGSSTSSDQLNHHHQPRAYSHRENHYLLHQQQQQQQSFDLGLNYSHIPMVTVPHQYQHNTQAQNFIPTHKPLGYDFSTLPSEDSPLMVKQLMSNPREHQCESGSTDHNLGYQQQPNCEAAGGGLEAAGGACEGSHQSMVGGGRDVDVVEVENMNEWGMIDDHRLVTSHHLGVGHVDDSSSSKGGVRFDQDHAHQINHLSLRGEMMDFWGYGSK